VTARAARPLGRLAAVATAAAGIAACGSAPHPPAAPPPAPLLPARALPELHSTARALDRPALALATPIPGLRDRLEGWGFRRAGEREFTGRSRDLAHVVARTVDFARTAGAAAYARTLAAHTTSYLGSGAEVRRLRLDGRTGWLIRAPVCGCHPQPPTLIVLVRRGTRVSFLSAAGDAASPRRVRALARGLP
jgi:hypothetical protein